ncbi:MAG: flagellar protein FlaG [bacterium]|jgi:uncharacterized FlaG/YvyC family protein
MAEITGIGVGRVPAPAVTTAPPPAPLPRQPVSPTPATSSTPPAPAPPLGSHTPNAEPIRKPNLKSFDEIVKPISAEEMSKFLRKLNMSTNLFAIKTDISFDERTNWFRVVVRNTETGQVIREIPPWDIGEIVEYIEQQVGKLLDISV